MSIRRYDIALIALMLAVGFLGMGAGYAGTRRLLAGLGAFALGGLCLALWAAAGKCRRPDPARAG